MNDLNVRRSQSATRSIGPAAGRDTSAARACARVERDQAQQEGQVAVALGGNAAMAEIARQMRLLSQQVSALSEHLLTCLRSQGVALSELSGAIDAVLADATATQALLERGLTTDYDGPIAPLLGLLQSVPESAAAMERPADG